MKISLSLPISILMVTLLGCKYHCPGYDLSNYMDISCRLGDTIIYSDGQGDTLNFKVKKFHSRGPYVFTSEPVMDYDCNYDTYYQTDTINEIYIFVKLEHTFIHRFAEDSEYGLYDKTYTYEQSDTVVDGKSYTKFVYTDLTGKRRISRFAKAFYRDVIEFYDSKTGKTWRRIN